MTRSEERELLADYLAACGRLAISLEDVASRVEPTLPMSADRIDRLPSSEHMFVLAYLRSSEQSEDALHQTIETIAQLMAFGKVERLRPRDVANKAEAYGIVDAAESWSEAVRTRTALTHEYPLRPDKRSIQLNRAWDARATLNATWASVQQFVRQEGLIEP